MNYDNEPNHITNHAARPGVHRVDLNTVLPLRAAVLRPGQPTKAAIFPADHNPTTHPHHWALDYDHTTIVCVASTYQQPLPANTHPPHHDETPPNSWRQLRGMATHPNHRRQGHGHTLLKAICQPLDTPANTAAVPGPAHTTPDNTPPKSATTTNSPHNIWCNARRSAVAFYEAAGFVVCSDEFEITGIGPHYVMALRVT